jgi:hypothetical protein
VVICTPHPPSRAHLFSQPPGIYHTAPALPSSSLSQAAPPFPKSSRPSLESPNQPRASSPLCPAHSPPRLRAASGCRETAGHLPVSLLAADLYGLFHLLGSWDSERFLS